MLSLSHIIFNSAVVQIMFYAIIACFVYYISKRVMPLEGAAALVEPVMPGASPYASPIECDDEDEAVASTTASPSPSPSPTSSLPSLVSDDDASSPSSAASSPLTPSLVVDDILVSTIKTAGHAEPPVAAKVATSPFYGALGLDVGSFVAPRRKPSPRTLLIGRSIEQEVAQSRTLSAGDQRPHPYHHRPGYLQQKWTAPTRLLTHQVTSTTASKNTSTSASSTGLPGTDVDEPPAVTKQAEDHTVAEHSAQQAIQSSRTPAVSDDISVLAQPFLTSNPVAVPVCAPLSTSVPHGAPATAFASEIAHTTNADVVIRHPDTDAMDIDVPLLPRHTRRRRHARAPALISSSAGREFETASMPMAHAAIMPTFYHSLTLPCFNINLCAIRTWQFGCYLIVLEDADPDVDMDAGIQTSTEVDGSAPMEVDSQPVPPLTNGLALPLPAPAPPAQQPSATVPKTSSGPAPQPLAGQNVSNQATAQANAASGKGKAVEKVSGMGVQNNLGLALPRSSPDVVKHQAAKSSAMPTSTSGTASTSLMNAASPTASSKRTETMLKYVLLKGKSGAATSQAAAARPAVPMQPARAAASAISVVSSPHATNARPAPPPTAPSAPVLNSATPVPGKLTKAQREEQAKVKAACRNIIAEACGQTPTTSKAGVARR